MITLTTTQRDLLAAARDDDGGATSIPHPRPLGLSALIKEGLAIVMPVKDGPSRLVITEAGRIALGGQLPSEPAAAEGQQPSIEQQDQMDKLSEERADSEPPSEAPPANKVAIIVGMLQRPEGASLKELMSATGWQAHSVRGAIAGAIKKKLGHPVTSEKLEGERVCGIKLEQA